MLDRADLALVVAAALLAAVAAGWVLHWVWTRIAARPIDDRSELAEMVTRLHRAEQETYAAQAAKATAEEHAVARAEQAEVAMAAMQARLDGALEGREAELTRALREQQVEAEATMEALGDARRRIAVLEAGLAARDSEEISG
ncbi:MAG: hypothetical protein AAF713_16410 [Pseudomonadota bacterium]